MKDFSEPAIIGWSSVLKGFIAGILVISGIINPFGFLIQSLLFIVGIIIFLEGIFPFGSIVYPFEMAFSFIGGAIVSIVFTFINLTSLLSAIVLIIAALIYIPKFYKHVKNQI